MLARVAQVGVDQQRAMAELGEQHREVGRDVAAALLVARADDGERPVAGLRVVPADHELGAQRAHLLDARVVRVERREHLAADVLGAGLEVVEVILLGERALQVFLADEAQVHRRLAEAHAVRLLQQHHLVGLGRGQLALVDQDRADVAVRAHQRAAGRVERQDVLL